MMRLYAKYRTKYLNSTANGYLVVGKCNVNVNLYSASSQKCLYNALYVPSTDQKDTSLVYDENSQFARPAHANCFGTRYPF